MVLMLVLMVLLLLTPSAVLGLICPLPNPLRHESNLFVDRTACDGVKDVASKAVLNEEKAVLIYSYRHTRPTGPNHEHPRVCPQAQNGTRCPGCVRMYAFLDHHVQTLSERELTICADAYM